MLSKMQDKTKRRWGTFFAVLFICILLMHSASAAAEACAIKKPQDLKGALKGKGIGEGDTEQAAQKVYSDLITWELEKLQSKDIPSQAVLRNLLQRVPSETLYQMLLDMKGLVREASEATTPENRKAALAKILVELKSSVSQTSASRLVFDSSIRDLRRAVAEGRYSDALSMLNGLRAIIPESEKDMRLSIDARIKIVENLMLLNTGKLTPLEERNAIQGALALISTSGGNWYQVWSVPFREMTGDPSNPTSNQVNPNILNKVREKGVGFLEADLMQHVRSQNDGKLLSELADIQVQDGTDRGTLYTALTQRVIAEIGRFAEEYGTTKIKAFAYIDSKGNVHVLFFKDPLHHLTVARAELKREELTDEDFKTMAGYEMIFTKTEGGRYVLHANRINMESQITAEQGRGRPALDADAAQRLNNAVVRAFSSELSSGLGVPEVAVPKQSEANKDLLAKIRATLTALPAYKDSLENSPLYEEYVSLRDKGKPTDLDKNELERYKSLQEQLRLRAEQARAALRAIIRNDIYHGYEDYFSPRQKVLLNLFLSPDADVRDYSSIVAEALKKYENTPAESGETLESSQGFINGLRDDIAARTNAVEGAYALENAGLSKEAMDKKIQEEGDLDHKTRSAVSTSLGLKMSWIEVYTQGKPKSQTLEQVSQGKAQSSQDSFERRFGPGSAPILQAAFTKIGNGDYAGAILDLRQIIADPTMSQEIIKSAKELLDTAMYSSPKLATIKPGVASPLDPAMDDIRNGRNADASKKLRAIAFPNAQRGDPVYSDAIKKAANDLYNKISLPLSKIDLPKIISDVKTQNANKIQAFLNPPKGGVPAALVFSTFPQKELAPFLAYDTLREKLAKHRDATDYFSDTYDKTMFAAQITNDEILSAVASALQTTGKPDTGAGGWAYFIKMENRNLWIKVAQNKFNGKILSFYPVAGDPSLMSKYVLPGQVKLDDKGFVQLSPKELEQYRRYNFPAKL